MTTNGLETKPQWTQDEAIAFECAKEVITDMIALLSAEIAGESRKATPDASLLAELYSRRSSLVKERASLRVHSHNDIARVRAEYGAILRAWHGLDTAAVPNTRCKIQTFKLILECQQLAYSVEKLADICGVLPG